jgi:hypothetical protein
MLLQAMASPTIGQIRTGRRGFTVADGLLASQLDLGIEPGER